MSRLNKDLCQEKKIFLVSLEGNQETTPALALEKAKELGMDLVEVGEKQGTPVCKLMDYKKFLFEKKKKEKEGLKKTKQVETKILKFGPNIGSNDLEVKLKQATGFIEQGDKVKLICQFKGRESQHKDLGMAVLKRFQIEGAVIEQPPKNEGKTISMIIRK